MHDHDVIITRIQNLLSCLFLLTLLFGKAQGETMANTKSAITTKKGDHDRSMLETCLVEPKIIKIRPKIVIKKEKYFAQNTSKTSKNESGGWLRCKIFPYLKAVFQPAT